MKINIEYENMQNKLFECLNKRNQILMKGVTKHKITTQEIINEVI